MFEWFWSDELWWPRSDSMVEGVGNITWKDMENQPGSDGYYPDVKDLHWSFLLGFVMVAVRTLLERFIIIPVAVYCGVSDKPKVVLSENPILEREYKKNKTKIDYSEMEMLSKQTDLTCRQIEIWFRKRKKNDAPSKLFKFADCGWHFMFYIASFTYGLVIMWEKPWLWDTKYCWIGFPRHYVELTVYWYYVIELAFYWSLVITVFTDHRRKDFKEMMIHHVATIFLLYFSWMCNFVRTGSLVLVLHDAADPWLAVGKMCKYAKLSTLADAFYLLFIAIWTITRLFMYPYYILYSTTIEPYHYLIKETYFTHWFFNFLLYTLLILHVHWSYIIYKVLFMKLMSGKLKDIRSGSEAEADKKDYINKANGVGDEKI